jgi:hypothetical protein
MTFTIRPAVREKIGLLFGIAGASGSGKTFCALTLAKGIANGAGKIAVIDTEAGRALHYAPKPGIPIEDQPNAFEFLHLDFGPPFTPERYIEAIRACEEAGATVIVIDSMSHEWNGEGGLSEMAEAAAIAAATDAEGNVNLKRMEAMTGPSWKKPKIRHKRMMARLIQCRTHLIFCLRAEEKVKFQKTVNKRGFETTEIVPIGFQPICEKAFIFEMSGSLTLHPETIGEPRYDLPHKLNEELRAVFPEGKRINADAGRRLRVWAETGNDSKPADKVSDGVRDLIERIQDAPNAHAIRAIDAEPSVQTQRKWLAKNRPDLAEKVTTAIRDALAVFESLDDAPDGDLGVAGEGRMSA